MSHRRHLHIVLLALVTLGSWAPAAIAQEEVQGSAKRAPAAEPPQAIKLGEAQKAPLPQAMVKAPLTTEQKALVAMEEEGRRQVAELSKTIEGMPGGPARVAMEKKVVQLKQDNFLKLLRAKVDFARARGDFASAQQGEMIIESILHPRPLPTTTVARPLPDKSLAK